MKVPGIGSHVVLVSQEVVDGKRVPVEINAIVVGYDRAADHDPEKDGQPKLHLVYFDKTQANRLDGLDYLDAFPRLFSVFHKGVDSTGHFCWFDAHAEHQKTVDDMNKGIAILRKQLAETTEGRDEALQKLADAGAKGKKAKD